MALKRATKSIPLTGGVHNEAPDELLQPPGMLHIENARFTKQDFAEKTEPLADEGWTGVANHTGQTPFVLEEVKGSLVAIGSDKFSRWDGTSFETTDHQADPLGLERALSTASQAGGNAFTWVPLGTWTATSFTQEGWAVAFEKRNNSSVGVDTDVVVQRFDLAGNFVDEHQLPDAFGPQLWNSSDSSSSRMAFMYDNGDLYRATINPLSNSTPLESTILVSASVYVGHQQMNGGSTYGPGGDFPTERNRLGFAYNTLENRCYVVKYYPQDGYGAIAWKDNSANNIKFQMLNASGTTTGSIYSLNGVAADILFTNLNVLLDVAVDANYLYVLHGVGNTTIAAPVGSFALYCTRVNHLNAGPVTSSHTASQNMTVPHGTLEVSGGVAYSAHMRVYGQPDYRMGLVNNQISGVRFYTENFGGAPTLDFDLRGFCLASNMVIDSDGDPNCVVEQWGNFTPNGNGFAVDDSAITPAAIKGLTSTLVKVDVSANTITAIGAFDAGQSRVRDASIGETSIHLNDLYYYDNLTRTTHGGGKFYHTFMYGNRNILGTEDLFCFVSDDATSPDNAAWGNASLVSGEARLNIYRLAADIPMHSVRHGDGFLINTSIPMWFDGGGLGEASILDQPEILSVDVDQTNGAAITWYAYNVLGTADPEDFQTLTVVCGYTDMSGNTHRSAPSFPVFVGGLQQQVNPVWSIDVTATPPLSISGTRREYFMEFYLASAGDSVPDLAATTFFTPNQSAQVVQATFFNVIQPTATAANRFDTPHQSKALYTAGNVLPADPWPSFKHMASTSRRMFAVAESAQNTIYYSKLFEENVSPEFSAALIISIGGARNITGLGTVDDKVIVFEKDTIHVIYGNGPDNTGANGDFFVERMSTQLGCEDLESILPTTDGLAFYSSITKEFHLITRDLQIVDFGRPVSDITANANFDVKSALLYPEANELRWYVTNAGTTDLVATATIPAGGAEQPPRARVGRNISGTGTVLVYNTEYQKWTVNSGPSIGYASALYNDKPAILDDTFNLWTTSTDWTLSEDMTWETPWIKINQLQDYGRYYESTFYGRYLSSWVDTGGVVEAGDLQIVARYDYEEDGRSDTYRFRANSDLGSSNGERLQFSIKPGAGNGKAQAIKFIITEIPTTQISGAEPTYASGRGIALSMVDIHYGVKGGSSRLPAGRKQ